METIDLVADVNKLFRTIRDVNMMEKITEDICPECLVIMTEIDRDGYEVPGPDRDCEPDYITTSIKYRCPECGEEPTIHQ